MIFFAYDLGGDSIVELGVDNVVVEGDRQICNATGIVNLPNGVGTTLRVDKSGAEAVVRWTASPVDASHDSPAFYRLHVSVAADSGFGVLDTATTTSSARPLVGITEYYKLSAVNDAGTSGDEPLP